MVADFENACQLCTVSFNIARHRTSTEPESEGWDYQGARTFERDPTSSLCSGSPQDSGCKNAKVEHGLLEHIAGPGCVFGGGYSGHRIGVKEMEGINQARYVVRKPYEPIPDHLSHYQFDGLPHQTTNKDEVNSPEAGDTNDDDNTDDYGKASKWFLTASTIEPPLASIKNLRFEKFGVQGHHIWAANSPCQKLWIDGEGGALGQRWYSGIAVHESCWKIFKMISLQKLGKVDIDGFAALWCREACRHCGFQNMKHDAIIAECKQRWWSHRVGSEYLAANPVNIPGFQWTMRGSCKEENPVGDGAFAETEHGRLMREIFSQDPLQNSFDPFINMPPEIKNAILADLCSRDIASLRLASSCFRQLPKALFRSLIKKEMPWFWELDELKKEEEAYLNRSFQESYGADMLDVSDQIHPDMLAFVKARMDEKYLDTNWLRVYKQLKVVEKGVLGVRNRSRIWKIVENVVDRIEIMIEKEGFEGAVAGFDFPIWPTDRDRSGRNEESLWRCPRCSENH